MSYLHPDTPYAARSDGSYQRSGRTGVRTWLALFLLSAALLSAATNVYQYKHRVHIDLTVFQTPCVEDGPGTGSDTSIQTLNRR